MQKATCTQQDGTLEPASVSSLKGHSTHPWFQHYYYAHATIGCHGQARLHVPTTILPIHAARLQCRQNLAHLVAKQGMNCCSKGTEMELVCSYMFPLADIVTQIMGFWKVNTMKILFTHAINFGLKLSPNQCSPSH